MMQDSKHEQQRGEDLLSRLIRRLADSTTTRRGFLGIVGKAATLITASVAGIATIGLSQVLACIYDCHGCGSGCPAR